MSDRANAPFRDQELLQQFLHGRDVACPLCEYNLRDLMGDRCPECGDQLVMRVNLAEPRQAAAITTLIGLSAGAGFSAMLLAFMVVQVIKQHWSWGSEEWRFFYVTLIPFLIEGFGLFVLLKRWRQFRRWASRSQWRIAISACILTLANLAIFTATIK